MADWSFFYLLRLSPPSILEAVIPCSLSAPGVQIELLHVCLRFVVVVVVLASVVVMVESHSP